MAIHDHDDSLHNITAIQVVSRDLQISGLPGKVFVPFYM